MEVVLVIVIAVLFALVAIVSLKGRRARQTARGHELGEARVSAEKGKAQQERSTARQADVRAAREEASNIDSDV